jgi:hypothetical protein
MPVVPEGSFGVGGVGGSEAACGRAGFSGFCTEDNAKASAGRATRGIYVGAKGIGGGWRGQHTWDLAHRTF